MSGVRGDVGHEGANAGGQWLLEGVCWRGSFASTRCAWESRFSCSLGCVVLGRWRAGGLQRNWRAHGFGIDNARPGALVDGLGGRIVA